MRDHWTRTEHLWPAGATRDTWLVTFDELPEIRELAAAYRDALDLPHLDAVPPEWLHLTLDGPLEAPVTAVFHPPVAVDEGVVMNADAALGAWPHVSLAYANGDGPAPDLPAHEPVEVTIGRCVRVRMRRRRGLYTWDVLEERASK